MAPRDLPCAARTLLADERGMAMPLAMLALLTLTVLIIGFSVLASTEPTIASNQLLVAQARAAAEGGIERAIWALGHPGDATNGIPNALSGTAAAPYDASQLVALASSGSTIGGFRVTVTSAAQPECPGPLGAGERCLIAIGWAPNDTSTTKAHQKVAVVVFNPRLAFKDPPAALSVRGELQMGGNSLVDSRSDQSCGKKVGTLTLGNTDLQGNATDIWGATDNNDTRNQVTDAEGGAIPANAGDVVRNVAPSVFDPFMWSNADINALRAYAKARGTYYQGTVSFVSGNLPNGVVFLDTVSGNNITAEGVTPATPSTDFASVDVHGNAPADPSGIFKGWLFVNGGITISGNFQMKGVVYAQNDIVYHGTGNGGVSGAMVSRNIRDLSSTSIDSDLNGNSNIYYNCQDAKTGGGSVPDVWIIKGGTYKELAG
jgi:hypothetical protein